MLNFNIVLESLCLMAAVVYLRKGVGSIWWGFIPFLLFTLLIEILATYIWSMDNGWLYNCYVLVQFGFLSAFFFHVNEHTVMRKLMAGAILLFYGFCILEYVFRSSFSVFNLLIFTIDCFFMVSFCILFLLYCIRENNVPKMIRQVPALWITIGVVLFYSIVSIVFNAYEFIRTNELKLAGIYLDNIAPQILSIVLYSCFAYAFNRWKKLQAE